MKIRCFFPCALDTSMFDIRIKMMVLYSGQKLFAKSPCGDGAVQKPSCRHADKTSHLITPQSCDNSSFYDNRINSYLNDLKTFFIRITNITTVEQLKHTSFFFFHLLKIKMIRMIHTPENRIRTKPH